MLNNRNDVLVPKYTASASLTGVVNGELVIAPVDTSLSVALIPFMRGDTGAQGEQGIQGVKGDKGDDGNSASDYVYTQIDASASWMVAHNQNRYPQVTVLNHLNVRIEPDVSYVDENIVLIEHATPTVGKAILS